MEIKHIDIALLEGNIGQVNGLPANPRKWTQREVERIAASLQETPELLEARPLVVVPNGSKYVVLGGNLRLAGIKHNQGTTAPCAVLPENTSASKLKEIVIKDNSSFGEWNFDMLSAEWDDMPLDDWGVKLSIGEDEVLPDVTYKSDNNDLWGLYVTLGNEEQCNSLYNKLITEGYECKIIH